MNTLMNKLSSRKFWIAVAAFLGSISASITSMANGNETIAAAGMICAALSAAIYVAAEAYVDAARESSNVVNITASTTAKEVVENVLSK